LKKESKIGRALLRCTLHNKSSRYGVNIRLDNLFDNQGSILNLMAFGLEIIFRVHPEVPDNLMGDPGRLRQVLVNLVGNAIKFTAQGEVVIVVEVAERGTADNAIVLHVSVCDTGIGIPEEKPPSHFEPFTQSDGSTTRLYGGTGLA